ncbi:hypothetical protein ACFW16_32640 [Inquilinus sp. NPDC058860]|uniref:hypothetical protein n=1 Tax=Inquilinus sp. NPDC058860 TaxID=3346652 RepID=UPI0036A9EE27
MIPFDISAECLIEEPIGFRISADPRHSFAAVNDDHVEIRLNNASTLRRYS